MKKPRTEKQKIAFAKAQYALALRRYKERIEYEQTLSIVTDTTLQADVSFKIRERTAEDIITTGICRERGGHLTRITGLEALKIQTKSLSNRASIKYLNTRYKENYIKALSGSKSAFDFTNEQIEHIRNLLNSVSDKHFELLVQNGYLPSIYEAYIKSADFPTEEDFIQAVENAVEFETAESRPYKRGRVKRGDIQRVKNLQAQIRESVRHIMKVITKE